MIKFFLILVGVFAVGTFALDKVWPVSVVAFGYQVQTSLITVAAGLFALLYLLDVILTPLGWMKKYRMRRYLKQVSSREAFWTLAAQTVLDKNPDNSRAVLKQVKSFYPADSTEALLIAGLFDAGGDSFEKLKDRPETELAGLHGLFQLARDKGDFNQMAVLLVAAQKRYASVPWVREGIWHAAVMQNDWKEALKVLDDLLAGKAVPRAEYARRKACLLLKLGRGGEAYRLDSANPAAALLYAEEKPPKARDILAESWAKTPCWDVFAAYARLIFHETPAQQMKLIEKLTRHNPMHKLSLLAVAQGAINAQAWGVAKETLNVYLEAYPLTAKAARMMAQAERDGWNHADAARDWEAKAQNAGADAGWVCGACHHALHEWDARCPMCNAFGKVGYR